MAYPLFLFSGGVKTPPIEIPFLVGRVLTARDDRHLAFQRRDDAAQLGDGAVAAADHTGHAKAPGPRQGRSRPLREPASGAGGEGRVDGEEEGVFLQRSTDAEVRSGGDEVAPLS